MNPKILIILLVLGLVLGLIVGPRLRELSLRPSKLVRQASRLGRDTVLRRLQDRAKALWPFKRGDDEDDPS